MVAASVALVGLGALAWWVDRQPGRSAPDRIDEDRSGGARRAAAQFLQRARVLSPGTMGGRVYDSELVVTGPASARRAMDHPAVTKQHDATLKQRRKHRTAVLVPCAKTKPFRQSPSHRLTYCPAVEGKDVDLWAVSEPMGVIPYGWSDEYPNDAYDFDPRHVKGDVRDQLVGRIRNWMEKQGPKYSRIFLALPEHHKSLVCDAAKGVAGVTISDRSVAAGKEAGDGPPAYDRVTTGAYRDFLRRSL